MKTENLRTSIALIATVAMLVLGGIGSLFALVALVILIACFFVETGKEKSIAAVNAAFYVYKKAKGHDAGLFADYLALKAEHLATYPKTI